MKITMRKAPTYFIDFTRPDIGIVSATDTDIESDNVEMSLYV